MENKKTLQSHYTNSELDIYEEFCMELQKFNTAYQREETKGMRYNEYRSFLIENIYTNIRKDMVQ